MTVSERSGKRSGSAARRFSRKALSAGASGSPGSCSPRSPASATIRCQRSRRAHDAAQDREPLRLEEARDDPVGRDHEVLDQVPGAVRLLGLEPAHGVAVELRAHLDGLELERAVLVAVRLQPLRHAVLELQVLRQPGNGRDRRRHRTAVLEPRADRMVGELGVVVHQGAVDLRRAARAVVADRDLHHHRETVHVGIERRQVGAQPVGQHREVPRRRVDRRGVGAGVSIERRAGRDRCAHVGDRDPDRGAAAGGAVRHRELVQIARVVVVDRAPGERAQVALGAVGARAVGQGAGLGQRGGREVGLEPVLDHRLPRDAQEQRALGLPGRCHYRARPRRSASERTTARWSRSRSRERRGAA